MSVQQFPLSRSCGFDSNWDQLQCDIPPSMPDELIQSISNFNFSDSNNRPVALRVSSCPDKKSFKSQKAELPCNLDVSDRSDPIRTYDSRVSGDRPFAFKLTRAATDPRFLNLPSDAKLDIGMPHRTLDTLRYERKVSIYSKKRLPVAEVKHRWRSEQIANQLRVAEGPGPRRFWSSWALLISRLPFTRITRRNQ
jgi:hypothetical protein